MDNVIIRDEYNIEVILQCMDPKIVDVTSADYVAEASTKKVGESGIASPFILAHPVEVTLKVETWLGTIITWTFTPGPYPMPLKRILTDAGNTVKILQISY